MERSTVQSYLAMKQRSLDARNARSNATWMTEPARFVVCLETGDYPVSLERWKVYRVLQLPADVAQRHGSQPARDH